MLHQKGPELLKTAAMVDDLQAIRCLLEQGCEVSLESFEQKQSILHWCPYGREEDIQQMLCDVKPKWSAKFHPVFSETFKQQVFTLLLTHNRLRTSTLHGNKASLGSLPREILFHIFQFLLDNMNTRDYPLFRQPLATLNSIYEFWKPLSSCPED